MQKVLYKHINNIDKLKIKMKIGKKQCKNQNWIRCFSGNDPRKITFLNIKEPPYGERV